MNGLLVAWLLLKLTRRGWLALFGGLLFAVHPLHTEAVAWASARKDVLSTFFFLASLITYLSYREGHKRSTYVWSLLSFTLGLLSKVTVITLPVILLLFDVLERRPWNRRMLTDKLPYCALSLLFGIIAIAGKTGVLGSSSVSEKILMAPKGLIFSLEKIFAPVGLTVLYPFVGDVSLARADILVPLLLFCTLLLITLLSLRWTRNVFFGIAFFLITISPTLPNFAKGDYFYFASDRYAYVPSIGIIVLIVLAIGRLCRTGHALCTAALSVILVTLGILSALQSQTWKDSEALFTRALAISPHAFVAHVNLGNVQRNRSQAGEAMTSYRIALDLLRRYGRDGPGLKRSESRILSNLASAKREQGDLAGAKASYEEALGKNPKNVYAMLGLGVIAGQQKEYATAEELYRQAILSAPDFAPAQLNLGALLVGLGRLEEGVTAYRAALDINPFFPQTHYNLGIALTQLRRNEEAMDAYREAVRLQPHYTAARINLGILLFNAAQDRNGAREQFEAILQYDPTNAQARAALQQMRGQ